MLIKNEIFNISILILTNIESLFLGTYYDTVHGPDEASQTGLRRPLDLHNQHQYQAVGWFSGRLVRIVES